MYRVYYLDLAAIFVYIALLASLIFRRMYRGKENRAFVHYVMILLILAVADIFRAAPLTVIRPVSSSLSFREFWCSAYNLLNVFGYASYIYMVGKMTGTFRRIVRNRLTRILYLLPIIADLGLVIMNSFTHSVFYYTRVGEMDVEYHRGTMMWAVVAVGYYYVAFAFIHIIYCYYKKMLDKVKFAALMVVFPLNIISFNIQSLRPHLLVQMFGFAISALVLSFFVISPEEYLDMETGAKSYTAFRRSVRNVYASNDDAFVMFGKLRNVASIRTTLGSEMYSILLRDIADSFYSMFKVKTGEDMNLYYLKNGLFAYVIRGNYNVSVIESTAQTMIPKLRDLFEVDGIRLKLDFAICGVIVPNEIGNERQLIKLSETYHLAVPLNKYVRYSEMAPEKDFIVRNNIDRIITEAIKNEKFEMYYQPIYSTKEGRFVSAEALIRLKDDQLGFISPGLFIPAAEKSGSILQIGDFVIKDVCRFLSDMEEENTGIRFVEVNLSVVQCMQANMASKIKEVLEEYSISPNRINFEITETASDYFAEAVLRTMNDISGNGNGFSLDDYGSGYSNLGRVMNFPYRIIKLDKSLVDSLTDQRSYEIMRQTISLLKSLGAEIVVEGVEDREKAEWFSEMGCEYIQGFYYAKPMPEAEFIEFCKRSMKAS
ncbi:MAG: EAL domain-containing protein [Lachnospiraceae bacterium]|nr:EAL domain-containing protein [Lachnospiraceae bacterium]